MEEWQRIVCGLVGLLIGAILLTYFTHGSDNTPYYERQKSKKKPKKKGTLINTPERSVSDDESMSTPLEKDAKQGSPSPQTQ